MCIVGLWCDIEQKRRGGGRGHTDPSKGTRVHVTYTHSGPAYEIGQVVPPRSTVIMAKGLPDKELEQIIESDEFWEDFDVNNTASSSSSTYEYNENTIEKEDKQEEDEEELSTHDTDSEQEWQPSDEQNEDEEHSASTSNEDVNLNRKEVPKALYGKDRTKWSTTAPVRGKTLAKNIIKVLPGLKGNAAQHKPQSALQAWKLLLTDEIFGQIITHTNTKIRSVQSHYGKFKKKSNSRSTHTTLWVTLL
ncbi:unnamed protein product [Acanthoscelides obtectus]|uniref:Uncharacterized protein n=1 Tax=Acanthoscelides obtectus TaxID=200917 RepID=A0A9P0QAM7_ACAOB|nr:unnamed protein product [Acanthoscelides obtectus]CAK1684689.1 hypothetical protein AOBTE_LOCUS35035 [Acanthoscelides obtectus]